MVRYSGKWVILAATAALLAGCASSSSTAVGGSPGASSEPSSKVNLGFVYGIANVAYANSIECGAKLAATEYGADLNFQAPANWSITDQKPIIDAVLATDPDAFVLAPTDPNALIPDVKKLMAEKTPVVTVDSYLGDGSGGIALQQVASDHYEGGKIGAEAMIKATGGAGTYLAIGYVQGDLSTEQRAQGFVDTMKAQGADVLPIPYPGADHAKVAQTVSATLKAHPDLAGIFSTNAEGAKGASNALVAAGEQGKIPLISFDASPEQVQDLKDGLVDMLLAQQPFREGYLSAKTAILVAEGKLAWDDVPPKVSTSFVVITKDNLDTPEAQSAIYAADTNNCPTTPPSS